MKSRTTGLEFNIKPHSKVEIKKKGEKHEYFTIKRGNLLENASNKRYNIKRVTMIMSVFSILKN